MNKQAHFIRSLPVTQTLIHKDIQAAYEGDPAAKSYMEIIFSYPGLLAMTFIGSPTGCTCWASPCCPG